MTSSEYRHITDELLSAYLDDAVNEQERQLIERAVADDNDVAWRLESLRQTVALLNTLPELPMPRSFVLSPEQLQPGGSATIAQAVTAKAAPARRVQPSAPVSRPAAAPKPGFWDEFLAGWRDFWQTGNMALRNVAAVSLVLMLALFGGSAYLGTATSSASIVSAPAASESAAESVAVVPTGSMAAAREAPDQAESVESAQVEPTAAGGAAESAPAVGPAQETDDAETAGTEEEAAPAADQATAEQEQVEQPAASEAVTAEAGDEQAAAEQTGAVVADTSDAAPTQAAVTASPPPQPVEPAGEMPQAQAAMTAPYIPSQMEPVPPSMIIPGGPEMGPEGMPMGRGGAGDMGGMGGGAGGDGMGDMPGVAPDARMFPPEAYEPMPTPLPEESSAQNTVTDTEIYSDTIAPPAPAAPAATGVAESSDAGADAVNTETVNTEETVSTETVNTETVPREETAVTPTAEPTVSAATVTAAEVALAVPSPQPTATATTAPAQETPASQAAAATTVAETPAAETALPVLAVAQAASVLITLMLGSLWWRSRSR